MEIVLMLLMRLALLESPTLRDESPKNKAYIESVKTMSQIYVEVGGAGEVVSPKVDPLLLAAMGYEESRHRVRSKDGDCDRTEKPYCHAVGPMQVGKTLPKQMAKRDSWWATITTEKLREPRTSVEAAYRLLRYWKGACKGGPVEWLGAWSAGKCVGKIQLGKRRCALAKAFGEEVGADVACSAPATDDATMRRITAIRKKEEE